MMCLFYWKCCNIDAEYKHRFVIILIIDLELTNQIVQLEELLD